MKAEPSPWQPLEDIVSEARELGFTALADAWHTAYLDDDAHRHIRIAFFGEFNHGKSSLINAIAGIPILPSGMTPTTQIDTYVRFNAELSRVTAWSGAECLCGWAFEDWKRHAVRLTAECLKKNSPDRIEIELDFASPIDHCIFIDTPGLNEASLLRESALLGELSRADIAVFVLDANQALTRTEAAVLEILTKYIDENKRLLVINKCDRLYGDEWLEICAHVEKSVAPVLGDGQFYMVSARDASVGDWQAFRQRLAGEAAHSMCDHDIAYAERTEKLLMPILRALRPIARVLDSLDSAGLKSVARSADEEKPVSRRVAADLIREIETETERYENQAKLDIVRFKQNFLNAMPRELDKSSIDDITGYFEDFIDEQYGIFARSHADQLLDALNALYLYAWQKLTGDDIPPEIAPETFHNSEDIFENVEKLIHHPVPTGAFDATSNKITSALLRPMLFGRLERPVRDALQKMCAAAIEGRCTGYCEAFSADITGFRNEVTGLIRETGRMLRSYIAENAKKRIASEKYR